MQSAGPTVAELADGLGFRSEIAFARSFKRVIGVAPGLIKREAESGPHEALRDPPQRAAQPDLA